MRLLSRFASCALTAAVCVLLCAAGAEAAEKADRPAAEGKVRVAVITGGHGYDRKAFPAAFASHDDIAFEIRQEPKKGAGLFDDTSKWPCDVMVLYNFRQRLSPQQQANFLKLLEEGVGLVVLHHAIAAYPDWDEYEKIVGCKYYLKPLERGGVKHPPSTWKHGVDIPVHVEDPNHAITKGLKDFTVKDETYGKWTYHPGSHVLLTTNCPLNVKQLAWVKTCRKSRVFFFQLGHGPGIFSDKNFRRIIAQAIRWTARRIGKDDPKPARAKGPAGRQEK